MKSIFQDEDGRDPTGRPFYTLYLGSPNREAFLPADRQRALVLVTNRFPSFTTLNGECYFQGEPLPTLIIQIATKDRFSLSELCQELCVEFNQDWIGVSDGELYRSVKRFRRDASNDLTLSVTLGS